MPSKTAIWIGRTLSGLFILFMALASIAPKLFFADQVVGQMDPIGWPQQFLPLIAAIELTGVVLYAIPRTSTLGAVFMTGLLGGAIAAHVRVGSPLYTHTLFGVYLGVLMWAGLWLRNPTLRKLLPVAAVRYASGEAETRGEG